MTEFNLTFLVENENHCDFTKLREMLIRTNMEDLRDTTHGKHYEVYRKLSLREVKKAILSIPYFLFF